MIGRGLSQFDVLPTKTYRDVQAAVQYLAANPDAYATLVVAQKDCGLGQRGISASQMGSPYELRLLTEPDFNVRECRLLFDSPWPVASGKRRFQPWAAYTSGWVMFPHWWVYTQAEPRHWAATGRFIHAALRGWANSLVLHLDHKVENAIYYGNTRARDYRIEGELVPGKRPEVAPVDWAGIPPKPTTPPADGVGPPPVPNDGQP